MLSWLVILQGLMMSAPVHYTAQQYGGGTNFQHPQHQDNMETEIM